MADVIWHLGSEHTGYEPLPTPRASLKTLVVSLAHRALRPLVVAEIDRRIDQASIELWQGLRQANAYHDNGFRAEARHTAEKVHQAAMRLQVLYQQWDRWEKR